MLASSPIITKQLMPHHNPFHCPCPFMLNSSILFYMLSALPQHALAVRLSLLAMVKKLAPENLAVTKSRPALVRGMEKKDLATPRSATTTGRRRVARRTAKRSGFRGAVRVTLQMNLISSLLLSLRTPANAYERCLYKDALARSRVRSAPQPASEGVLFACGACAARQARDCICSGIASLHGNVDFDLFSEFTSGIRSPENPVYQPYEPDDQKNFRHRWRKVPQCFSAYGLRTAQVLWCVAATWCVSFTLLP